MKPILQIKEARYTEDTMEITKEEILSIKVIGDDCKLLKSIIKKVLTNEKTIGFGKSILNEKENDLLNNINEKL